MGAGVRVGVGVGVLAGVGFDAAVAGEVLGFG